VRAAYQVWSDPDQVPSDTSPQKDAENHTLMLYATIDHLSGFKCIERIRKSGKMSRIEEDLGKSRWTEHGT
jgi:hypothetical protein